MAKFCRSCGSALEAEARFCGECGAPVVSKVPPLEPQSLGTNSNDSSTAAPKPKAGLSRQGVLIAGVMCVFVFAGGAAAWWFTQAEELTDAVFLREAKRSVELNPKFWDGRFCLTSFVNYKQSEIRLRDTDLRSRQWFDMLAADGLYAPAQKQVFNDGWADQIIWVFQQTEKGKAALRNNRLCYANNAEFTTVSFSPPEQLGQYKVANGKVTFQVKDPAAWSQSAMAKDMAPEIIEQSQGEKRIELILVDRKWQLPTPELIQLVSQSEQDARLNRTANNGSWLDRLLSVFQSTPTGVAVLFGQWETETIFGQDLAVDLDANSITIMGERTDSIRYLPSKNSEWIRVKNAQNINLIELRVIDENTLGFRLMGMAEGKMHRRR